jgi:hypothetical protein
MSTIDGVISGDVGVRDMLVTSTGKLSLQEVNLVPDPVNWYDWRVLLYTWGASDSYSWPLGTGSFTQLSPFTDGGSYSIGGPKAAIVTCPSGSGQCLWGSYFIFSQGAAPGEAGEVEYYQAL